MEAVRTWDKDTDKEGNRMVDVDTERDEDSLVGQRDSEVVDLLEILQLQLEWMG